MTRTAAFHALRSGGFAPTRRVTAIANERGFDARDRGFLRHLVGTVVRRRGTLLALVHAFARGKPDADTSAMLQLGFAQLFYMDRVPPHAAVSETVRATTLTLGMGRSRYVNGVLRTAVRARRSGESGDPRCDVPGRPWHFEEPILRDPDTHPLLWMEDALSMPAPLLKRWSKRYGLETARGLAELFLEEPRLSLRVARGTTEEARAALEAAGVELESSEHPSILRCAPEHSEAALGTELFSNGSLTVQGEHALRAAELVGAQEGERILDLCAAPGGKTAVLAAAGADVLAVDVEPGKEERLRSTLDRMGVADKVQFRVSDGTAALEAGESEYDAVLVDAPCSNTGVLGSRPDARWRFGPQQQRSLCELQGQLLREGAERVRSGGRLVWSTCSLEPEENAQQVGRFVTENDSFTIEEEIATVPSSTGSTDGGYAARLARR